MINEELNIEIQSYLEPDKCRHDEEGKWRDDKIHKVGYYPACSKCETPKIFKNYNTDYITPDGIAKIKAYLEKEGKWELLIDWVHIKIFELELAKLSGSQDPNKFDLAGINTTLKLPDIFTNPLEVAKHFTDYMKK